MKLIKILRDRVQIKTDQSEFENIRINDLLSISDGEVTLAAVVTSLSSTEETDSYIEEEDYIVPKLYAKTIEGSIIGEIRDGVFQKSVERYPTTNITADYVIGENLNVFLASNTKCGFEIGTFEACDAKAFVNGNRFFQKHSCIVGNTGSGKSETLARILQEAAGLGGTNMILFDIHGEYRDISYVDAMRFGEDIDFPIWMFGFSDMIVNLLKIKEESATVYASALRKCYKKICPDADEGKPVYFDYSLLLRELKLLNSAEVSTGEYYKTGDRAGMPKLAKGELNGKLSGLIHQMEVKQNDKQYDFLFRICAENYLEVFLERLLCGERPVKCIDLSEIPHDVVIPVIGAITKLVYEVQKASGCTDRPITFVCDEAHIYIPNNFQLSASEKRNVEVFENIAKEGRKFGVTLLIASQRPSELNKTIMAQCANFIVMKLNNETDKAMIKGMLPDGSESIVDQTTMFAPGECIIVGDAAQMPMKIKVALARERPTSRTIDFWDEWHVQKAFNVQGAIRAYMN